MEAHVIHLLAHTSASVPLDSLDALAPLVSVKSIRSLLLSIVRQNLILRKHEIKGETATALIYNVDEFKPVNFTINKYMNFTQTRSNIQLRNKVFYVFVDGQYCLLYDVIKL